MRTRWMIVGSLLTVAIIAVMVLLGGRVLAQQGTDDASTEPPVTEPEPEPELEPEPEPEAEPHGFHFDMHGQPGHGAFGVWVHVGDESWGPLVRLAEIVGVTPDELREALADGQTLAEIAEANGVARQELADALLAEVEAHLAEAAEHGFFDQEQGDFILDWATDGIDLLLDHPFPLGETWLDMDWSDWHGLGEVFDVEDFDPLERLAELLGITSEELIEAILDGQTLAEIAEANGVEPEALLDTLVAEAEAKLDEAVAAGHLTEEQAEVLLGWLRDGLDLIMDNSFAFPNGLEFMEHIGPRLSFHMQEMDWGEWPKFDWSGFDFPDPLSVAAETIGISRDDLLQALKDGQTLEEIAEAHGVDAEALAEAQIEAMTGLLKDLPEGFPDVDLDIVIEDLPDLKMFMAPGFPFGEHWGDEGSPWLEHWFNCCPCDEAESGE